MHVRISIVTGATDIDAGVAFVREEVLPQLEQQSGFRGLSASADRATGKLTVLSVWETEADLQASESAADKARGNAVDVTGGTVRVERYEQTAWETGSTPPGPGAQLHIRHIKMDPARVDENLVFFRQNVAPELKSAPGFLGLRQLIDRATGEGRVGTLWTDRESMDSAVAAGAQRRATAGERGVEFGADESMEVLFASMR